MRRREALPLRGDRRARFYAIAFDQARQQQGAAVFEARGLQGGQQGFVHSDRLHEVEVLHMALRADGFGGEAEVLLRLAVKRRG